MLVHSSRGHKTSAQAVYVNKVLLEHSYTHSFTFCHFPFKAKINSTEQLQ